MKFETILNLYLYLSILISLVFDTSLLSLFSYTRTRYSLQFAFSSSQFCYFFWISFFWKVSFYFIFLELVLEVWRYQNLFCQNCFLKFFLRIFLHCHRRLLACLWNGGVVCVEADTAETEAYFVELPCFLVSWVSFSVFSVS